MRREFNSHPRHHDTTSAKVGVVSLSSQLPFLLFVGRFIVMPREHLKAQISFKLFLKNADGCVLVGTMPDDACFPGFYDVPGGRMEIGEFHEPIEKIIEREVREELGSEIRYRLHPVPVAFGRHCAVGKDGSEWCVMQIYFEADLLGGEARLSDEHAELKWVDLSAIPLEKHFASAWLEAVRMYLGRVDTQEKKIPAHEEAG